MPGKTSLRIWEGAAKQAALDEEVGSKVNRGQSGLEHEIINKQLTGLFRGAEIWVVSMPPYEVSQVMFGLDTRVMPHGIHNHVR
jgi:hypothetical protein